MKKFFIASLILATGAPALGAAPLKKSIGDFVAPTVNGKDNIVAPQIGTIVYDVGANQFFAKDSSASGWQPISSGATASISSVYIKDVKSSGTNGGTPTASTWTPRDLNTLENPLNVTWVSIGTNQITLQSGTYEIEASAPALGASGHQLRLYNVTDSSTTVIGTSEFTTSAAQTSSHVAGTFNIATQKTFEIQHYVGSAAAGASGLGSSVGAGNEIYTVVKLTKVN